MKKNSNNSSNQNLAIVTGAFSFTGRHITERLLNNGTKVKTITSKQQGTLFSGHTIHTHPYTFTDKSRLIEFMKDSSILYNTYWVRFNTKDYSFDEAVNNSEILFSASKEAGIKRIVHVSVLNQSTDSPFEYYRRKSEVEEILKSLGVTYTIIRPSVLFAHEDVLINNIIWFMRKLPAFAIFGNGM